MARNQRRNRALAEAGEQAGTDQIPWQRKSITRQ